MTDERQSPGRRTTARAEGEFSFDFEGRAIPAWPGDTVAAALLAAGEPWLRVAENGEPRGAACGIGACWECRCVVDGRSNVRACITAARPGMKVGRQRGIGR